jgi:hypothetical protein
MNKPSVDPAFSFGVALIVSLVLWYPTLHATLHGDIDITDGGIRYLLALAISWAGVYGICALVAMYASKPRQPRPPRGGAEQAPQRRREDPPVLSAPEETPSETNAA